MYIITRKDKITDREVASHVTSKPGEGLFCIHSYEVLLNRPVLPNGTVLRVLARSTWSSAMIPSSMSATRVPASELRPEGPRRVA